MHMWLDSTTLVSEVHSGNTRHEDGSGRRHSSATDNQHRKILTPKFQRNISRNRCQYFNNAGQSQKIWQGKETLSISSTGIPWNLKSSTFEVLSMLHLRNLWLLIWNRSFMTIANDRFNNLTIKKPRNSFENWKLLQQKIMRTAWYSIIGVNLCRIHKSIQSITGWQVI